MKNEETIKDQSQGILQLLMNQSNFYEDDIDLSIINEAHQTKIIDKLNKQDKPEFT